MSNKKQSGGPSRRDFVKGAAAIGAAGALNLARMAHAAGGDTIRVGFVGCGGRGTGACRDALASPGAIKLVAMGDLFADRLETSLANLRMIDEIKDKIDVAGDRKFVGFDAFQKVLACDVDLVLLTTPPVFRPMQYAAAVAAGKHVFMEKPVCVDGPGYRSIVESNKVAKEKKLSVGVGFQRHHQRNYLERMKRLRNGAVGEILYVRTYFNMPSGTNPRGRPANLSEMEYQIRNWNVFAWLCGDHIVEQACHEIDIANWVISGHPIRANGMGGRQVRMGKGDGDIWDHHCVEYEHEGGVRHFCQARQQPGVWSHVSDNVHGTKGKLVLGSGPYGTGIDGYRKEKELLKDFGGVNPYEQEHRDLQASIRGSGPHQFEGDYAADSSMTAVLGRMATYSGKVVEWNEAVASTLSCLPKTLALDAEPPTKANAEGYYPIATPGVTGAW